jgi:hypothetical chaperone protein
MGSVLGVDFGTSNSAAGVFRNGRPRLVRFDNGQPVMPTTFFFDFDSRQTLIGEAANAALLTGAEGRFMRALKRVLGTQLMHEKRQIMNERLTFVDIIGRFLRHLKTSAEREFDQVFDRALSGRPVFFHGPDDPRNDRALSDLRACYLAAGFEDVAFLAEPEAAAIAAGAMQTAGKIGLIVDIGGGTSDFSLFRREESKMQIIASHGLRIGGTDFDRSISIDHVMPLLGQGGELRKMFGQGRTPVPNAIFHDLATWEKIPFLYTPQNRRVVEEMRQLAEAPDQIQRLASTLEHELGHDISFAVEHGKIQANAGVGRIALDRLEPGLGIELAASGLAQSLDPHRHALGGALAETLRIGEVAAREIDQVIYVGGSSLMGVVSDVAQQIFPDAHHNHGEVFTGVADGLAIAAAQY